MTDVVTPQLDASAERAAMGIPGPGGGSGRTARPRDFGRRLLTDKASVIGLVLLGLVVVTVLVGPLVWTKSPLTQDLLNATAPPSGSHPLGTDENGRDVLARVLNGGRASLAMAFAAMALSTAVALLLALACVSLGRRVDNVIMRVCDVVMAIPSLLLAAAVAITLGPSVVNTVLAVTIPSIPRDARIFRAALLSVRGRDFVFAAEATGVRRSRVLTRHVLANGTSPIIINAAISFGFMLLEIAALGFLGLGVQPPNPEWGAMLSDGRTYLVSSPLIIIVPGTAIFITVVAANLVGDALRDAFDTSR